MKASGAWRRLIERVTSNALCSWRWHVGENMGVKRKRLATAFGAGLVYFGLESLGGLVLIPTMARYLAVEDVGTWILFIAFIPLVPLSISGFAPLVVREIAAAHAVSDGDRIRSLIVDARRRSNVAAAGLLVVLIACYGYFVHPVRHELDTNVLLAWLLFCIALLTRLDVLRAFAVINGFGRIGIDKFQMAIGSFVILSASLVLVINKQDLMALSLLHAVVYAAVLLMARRTESRIVREALNIPLKTEMSTSKRFRVEVIKMYLMSVGGFLTMNTDLFIAKKLASGSAFVEYSLVSRFALALIAVASLYIQINFPSLSAMARPECAAKFALRGRRIQWLVTSGVAVCASLISVGYPWIIKIVLGQPPVLPPQVIYFFMIFAVLCANIIAVGQGIIAAGDSNLVRIALSSAVAGFFFAILAAGQWGLAGIPAGLSLALVFSLVFHHRLYRERVMHFRRHDTIEHA